MIELTNETYQDFTKEGIVIVDVWSPTCAPCRLLLPILEELSVELGDTVPIGKLNAADYREKAISLNIRNVPTLLFYKNGKLVTQTTGVQTQDNIKKIIKDL